MSTYEELQLITSIALLIVAILTYTQNKVGKPTSTSTAFNLEGLEHFARRRNTARR